jgi:transposase
VPKPFPAEFRRDVIAVAHKGEASIAQGARDFGISESCLARWLKMADPEELRLAFITWIEKTYNRRRLGRLTPVEYETLTLAAAAA